jgi:hypothetical protein
VVWKRALSARGGREGEERAEKESQGHFRVDTTKPADHPSRLYSLTLPDPTVERDEKTKKISRAKRKQTQISRRVPGREGDGW